MEKVNKSINEFREQAISGFLNYQALKFDLSKITPLQDEYHRLVFKENSCSIGDIVLEETSYICDARLPNNEVKNVVLEAKRLSDGKWQVTLKVNFFGLCLCVHHTKEKQYYYVGIPDNFSPSFKVLTKEFGSGAKRNDNLILEY
jgi:hypothetical protein